MREWYGHVCSASKKIAEQIRQQAAQGLADKIDEILVPTEQVTVRRGQDRHRAQFLATCW